MSGRIDPNEISPPPQQRIEPLRAAAVPARIDWVDCSRGWCILLVVAMHTIMGVGAALQTTGWPHEIVIFAKPFRMPDFFLIAGLFAHRAIDRRWPEFLDRKILFFAYFYGLWVFITYGVKQGLFGAPGGFLQGYFLTFVQPFSDLWFIHLLPFLYLAARLLHRLPVIAVMGAAVVAHIVAAMAPEGGVYTMGSKLTGWTTPDAFLLYLAFFLGGYFFRDGVFRIAALAALRPVPAGLALALWAVLNAVSIRLGLTEIPGLTLLYGGVGALAVVVASAVLTRAGAASWLAFLGRRSLFIYISFVLPMAATRMALLKSGVTDVAMISTLVLAAAIVGPLALERLTRRTFLSFLYHRPAWTFLTREEKTAALPKQLPA